MNKVREAYPNDQVNVVIYEGDDDQVEKVANELIKYYPQSKITDELLARYIFKQTIYAH